MASSRKRSLPRSKKDREEYVRKLLTKKMRLNLYSAARYLAKDTEQRTGLRVRLPIYIQDPLVAEETPELGIQEIDVRWEPGLDDGPTSARIAVVDYNADTGSVTDPARWDETERQFTDPDGKVVGPNNPESFQFHQVNVWATIQRIVEFYENPRALGRPVLWGFNGGRLIVVPHAGYGENAFYDRQSKSLQFYYYGSPDDPSYTCLSHDIVAHETGHAILDGIRPLYNKHTSIETAAFHEFIGDLTAIIMSLHNADIRHHLAEKAEGDLSIGGSVVSNLAEEFGQHVKDRKYLRSAQNKLTMADIENSTSPHHNSQVLTGAMFDIMTGIARKHLDYNKYGDKKTTPAQALWWAAERFGRIALQPLDLCPPADIRFIDYARAVIRNDELTNALDPQGFRQIMNDVFHQRGLCEKSNSEHDQGLCDLNPPKMSRFDFIYHSIERLSRSRAAAYYFLDDNRHELRIPYHQDIQIVDLYDTNKQGRAAEKLPRQIVLEYIWHEDVELKGAIYGDLDGRTTSLICGGTLVFDGRGNVISWFRKPGTESEADKDRGRIRRQQLLDLIADRVRQGMIGLSEQAEMGELGKWTPPIVARPVGDTLEFELIPHLHESSDDVDLGEDAWTTSF